LRDQKKLDRRRFIKRTVELGAGASLLVSGGVLAGSVPRSDPSVSRLCAREQDRFQILAITTFPVFKKILNHNLS